MSIAAIFAGNKGLSIYLCLVLWFLVWKALKDKTIVILFFSTKLNRGSAEIFPHFRVENGTGSTKFNVLYYY